MNFSTNDHIGKYRIIGELGRGGMGVVYLAEDTNLARRVSLKFLQGSLSQDGAFKAGFQREARLISSVVHPNIVQIHSLDELDGHLFIDMEYVEGQSLAQLMLDGPLSLPLASHLALDVLQGLAVCHRTGVIHRDIKPSNILLTTSGQGKILDFGIASALADSGTHALEQSESTMVFMGTPRYMPPEAWDEQPADQRWDLYALGVMLHEALTGKVVYESRTMLSLMREIATSPLPPIESKVEGISSSLAEAINGMVNPHPEKRLDSAEAGIELIRSSQETKSYSAMDSPTITVAMPKISVFEPLDDELISKKAVYRALLIAMPLILIVLGAMWMSDGMPVQDANTLSGDEAVDYPLIGFPTESIDIWLAQQVGAEDVRQWVLYLNSETGDSMYGFSDQGLAQMSISQSGNALTFEGQWAEYRTPGGMGFQAGSLSGSGIRHEDGNGFTMTCQFYSDRDRSVREETYYVSRNPDYMNRESFVRAIESQQWLPALLAFEIRPRRLELGTAINALFPSNRDQKVVVPRIDAGDSPTLDGELTDAVWARSFFGEEGRHGDLPALYGNASPLCFRHDGESLYVALTLEAEETAVVSVRFSIRQLVEKPLQDSARTELSVDRNGHHVIHHFVGGAESRLPDEWDVRVAQEKNRRNFEIKIPLAEELRLSDEAGVRNTLRVNCSVQFGEETGPVWGYINVSQVEHGAVIVLE